MAWPGPRNVPGGPCPAHDCGWCALRSRPVGRERPGGSGSKEPWRPGRWLCFCRQRSSLRVRVISRATLAPLLGPWRPLDCHPGLRFRLPCICHEDDLSGNACIAHSAVCVSQPDPQATCLDSAAPAPCAHSLPCRSSPDRGGASPARHPPNSRCGINHLPEGAPGRKAQTARMAEAAGQSPLWAHARTCSAQAQPPQVQQRRGDHRWRARYSIP